MPGMSPRIKAKKGRFGAGGLIHTVQILSPLSGSSFSLGSPSELPFTATAKVTDDLGAVTGADVVWSATGVATGFSAANGTPTAVTFDGAGAFTLTATVTNGTQVVTDSITGTVTA